MQIKKASEIKKGDEISFWPGWGVPNQVVSRVAEVTDPQTQAELILIEVDDQTNDGLKWPPNAEIHVGNK
ncbi:hypothetical protein [Microcoleus sp. herbarium14]|uniref:hypothetical protein n=1 Tax=Microcoleus sp. herbarium14 TaxID=3055439 RepID=UPI002FD0D33E